MTTIDCIRIDNLQRVDFRSADIVPGDERNPFYLDVKYEFENSYGIFELRFPKINIGAFFSKNELPFIRRDLTFESINWDRSCYGAGSFLKMPSAENPAYIEYGHLEGRLYLERIFGSEKEFEIKVIKEKEKEMTVEQIEKALGYKVKIVS